MQSKAVLRHIQRAAEGELRLPDACRFSTAHAAFWCYVVCCYLYCAALLVDVRPLQLDTMLSDAVQLDAAAGALPFAWCVLLLCVLIIRFLFTHEWWQRVTTTKRIILLRPDWFSASTSDSYIAHRLYA